MTNPNPIVDRELLESIRTLCDSPHFADDTARLRAIRAMIDEFHPVDVSPAAAAAEVPADLAPVEDAHGVYYVRTPMTGAEALDAAATPEEWAATAGGIFTALTRAAERAEDEKS